MFPPGPPSADAAPLSSQMRFNFDKIATYAALVAALASMSFSINAQNRLGKLEYEVADKHEMLMSMIGQLTQRLSAMEGLGHRPSNYLESGGNFE